jgi:Zn-dependent M28 family amino/carboxypeptidase
MWISGGVDRIRFCGVAEEVGLLGSQAIASSYKSAGKAVKAAFILDMIA